MVKEIESLQEFEDLIAGEKPVIVDFTATWCGPCKMIAPKFQTFSEQYTNVTFVKVDVDERDDIASKYGVTAMPTFKVFKNGNQADEVVGASVEKLEEMIKRHN